MQVGSIGVQFTCYNEAIDDEGSTSENDLAYNSPVMKERQVMNASGLDHPVPTSWYGDSCQRKVTGEHPGTDGREDEDHDE
jgi:hypothetical protein